MIETKSAHISLLNEDTIKVIFKPGAVLTNKEYQSFGGIYEKLLDLDKGVKFLVIIQEGARVKTRFIDFYSKQYRTDYKKAEAYIILNPNMKMLFSVGKKIMNRRRNYPIKGFENEQDALSWLETIK